MPKKDGVRKVAYVEDADDAGNAIPNTETYAASVPPTPPKEKPNTSKMRRAESSSAAPGVGGYTDSDSTVHPISALKRTSKSSRSKEKDGGKVASTKKVTINERPPPPRHKTTTAVHTSRRQADDASYYGVNTTVPVMTPSSSRPRAHTTTQRPSSYYGPSSRPPLANSRWHDQQYAQPAASSPLPPTTYPPNYSSLPRESPFAPRAAPLVSQPPADYFSSQPHLASRFVRPASAMAQRPSTARGLSDYDAPEPQSLVRRTSTRAAKEEEDRRRMPPPSRPHTTRPAASAIRPPPPRPSGFDDDAFRGEGVLYQDISPLSRAPPPYDYPAPGTRSRRQSLSLAAPYYDVQPFRTDVATTGGSRRNSYYGQSTSSGSGYEDKVRQAHAYQEELTGGPGTLLTAEALRKARRSGGSGSRSTRSSASKDESDYKHSATTRTTQFSNDEDVTIRVKGSTVLEIGGATMKCEDGAEVVVSRGGIGTSRAGGSDRSSWVDPDDLRSRIDRQPSRVRASSQASSYTRTLPAPQYESYGYRVTTAPPYPAYPGTYVARPDGWV